MVTKDVKKLLEKLNDHTTRSLEAAAGFSISRTHYQVGVEHVLAKLLEDGNGDIPQIFNHFDVKSGKFWEALLKRLDTFKDGNTGRPSFSPVLMQLIESAWITASVHHNYIDIRSGAILEALLDSESLQTASYFEHLSVINRDELRQNFRDIVANSAENTIAGKRTTTRPDGSPPKEGETALDLFCTDVTGAARDGQIDPVNGRDEEIRQIIDILSRRRKNNPILVGEAGVGKTAVVEGLALRLATGDVPDSLKETEIRGLDLGLLQAGAGVKGEFEQRLKSVIKAVRTAPKPTILFIDEAHTLIGAGGAAGTADAANLLKPALARGELRTIAATTWAEYKKYIEKDPALERRFQRVKIAEPTIEKAVIMLRGIKSKYEDHHNVAISDDAVFAAASLSARFVGGRQLPDKAVDVLDTAAARVKMAQTAKPAAVDDAERTLMYLDQKIAALRADLAAGVLLDASSIEALKSEHDELTSNLEALTKRWDKELQLVKKLSSAREKLKSLAKKAAGKNGSSKGDSKIRKEIASIQGKLDKIQGDDPLVFAEVNASVAAQVISDWTGIPAGAMEKDEVALLLELEDRLGDGLLGQEEAISQVADSIRTSKSGMRDPNAPHAVFLFVGPSGVGKTELALRIADIVYGGDRFLTTINMSEYQEKHTVSQLKGAPPGYVGYGEGGILTEAVRRQPYSVILLDEVEKAHIDVMNLFYQVFDKGFMRDGEGREIDFSNTIIILTSNLATDIITYVATEDERPSADQVREAVHSTLSEHFQPALLGRMKVVPFYPLRKEPMKGIVRIKLNRIGKRLMSSHKMMFEYGDKVVDRIAERCTQADTGARNIDFIIDRTVLPEASKALIAKMTEEEMPSKLVLGMNKKGDFTYTFSD